VSEHPSIGTSAANGEAPQPAPAPDRPDPEFEILGVDHVERAAAPTLRFRVGVRDSSKRPIYTIALTLLIMIEPSKRRYAPAERERLVELFGEPERWASTTQSFRWAQAYVLVPRFSGETAVEVPVPCTYDHEVAASKYLGGLDGGEAPLRFDINGTIFYEAGDGRLQLLVVPWDRSVRYSMPVDAWRRMIAAHYPFRRWIALDADTVDRLARRRAARGLPSFDACVDELLSEAD
jgi:uncharacterized protein DUF6084